MCSHEESYRLFVIVQKSEDRHICMKSVYCNLDIIWYKDKDGSLTREGSGV